MKNMESIKVKFDKQTLIDKYNSMHEGEYKLYDEVLETIKDYLYLSLEVGYINANKFIEAVEYSTLEKIKPFQFRKYIQIIRENKFTYKGKEYKDLVVVANNKGYKLTRDPEEIKNYLTTLNGRRHSLIKQIVVMGLAQTEEAIMEAQDEKGMSGY